MMAGITPCLSVLNGLIAKFDSASEESGLLRVLFVNCNKSEEDVLLEHELDTLAIRYHKHLTVKHLVTTVSGGTHT